MIDRRSLLTLNFDRPLVQRGGYASTAALEMSRFHQLSLGKSGKGPGSGPPIVLTAASVVVRATSETSAAKAVGRRRGIARNDASDEPLRFAQPLGSDPRIP